MKNRICNLHQFITAGNAIFTVNNTETGNRFTYKVRKKQNEMERDIYFVSVLSGSCNETDYRYIGMITPTKRFIHTRGSSVSVSALSFIAFSWVWNNIKAQMPSKLEFRHDGRCGRCGRKLTTPDSIDRGFGPECIQYV